MATPYWGSPVFRMGFLMKSWLLDADMTLDFSHQEGFLDIYTLNLSFVDLYGNKRNHMTTVELPQNLQTKMRISFTALSSVNARIGVVSRISDLEVEISLLNDLVVTYNSHTYDLKVGDTVYLVEHLHPSEETKLTEVIVPFLATLDKEMLCIQSINADILQEDETILYRLSMSPLDKGVVHVKNLAA